MAERNERRITIGPQSIDAGKARTFDLDVSRLPSGTWMSLPVRVVNGRKPGPTIWLSGAIHGDEINGVEIIRRVMRNIKAATLNGAVIAVPIVNVFGFIEESRYMPDRRDLNRSFPGSKRGSLAARLAHLFTTEVVDHCDVGIDLHTAASHRINLAQIRGDLENDETHRLATAFGAPFMINARLRDGSLREAATSRGKTVLVYEAGQVHRFDDGAVQAGVEGILRTMGALGMGSWNIPTAPPPTPIFRTKWVRARRGGIATMGVGLGEEVEKGSPLATIADAFGRRPAAVKSPADGWVIAMTQNPLVSPGDAIAHIAVPGVPGRDEPAERRRRG